MAKIAKTTNPVILRRGVGIGTGNAESDDEFLFECFVDYPPVQECMRVSSPKMIISGRTGSGKTAILRHVEAVSEHHLSLDPFDMSMSYVSNSDALRFLEAIGADLDLLLQVLWKHVLCIEFIRLRWNVESAERSTSIFSRIADRFSKEDRKSKSINYLREWQGKFWITMDQNIKEITESVERKLHAEIGAEIEKFKAGGQYGKRLSTEKKSEIVARTRKIISSDQLVELHGVIDMLSAPEHGDQMKDFYILIDRLDEKWVDDTVRFRMIKALMESLRSFRKIQNLKILVGLRSDVLERVVQETADISFQREKFEDYTIQLVWTKADLRTLVDNRIVALFKRQYTGSPVGFDDIFPPKVGPRNTFDWLAERTLMRPRDMIAFVNECFNVADGQSSVSVSALRKAEMEFARKRKDALIQEWKSVFPSLDKLLDFAAADAVSSDLRLLAQNVDDLALQICHEKKQAHDPIYDLCQAYADGKQKCPVELVAEIAAVLFRTGAVGVKLRSGQSLVYSHIGQPLLSPKLMTEETRIRLHPMLHAAFHLHDPHD